MPRFFPSISFDECKARLANKSDDELKKILISWQQRTPLLKLRAFLSGTDEGELESEAARQLLAEREA